MSQCLFTFLRIAFLVGFTSSLMGCLNWCFDCRGELQESWIENKRLYIGQNIYAPNWANRANGYGFVGSKTLPNGNIEDQYFDGFADHRDKDKGVLIHNCSYFYEYEPKSGLIVNFRFEEKKKYDCRATGA